MRVAKRVPVLFAAAAVTIGLLACSTPSPQAGSAQAGVPASATQKASQLERLYARADANHDGRVTREEARGILPITYAEYDKVDVDKRGWISLQQYLAFHEARTNHLADDIEHIGNRQ
jgi:hypothetical protein